MLDESRFRNVAEELDAVIDDGLGHAANHVPLGEIRKFADFDDITMCKFAIAILWASLATPGQCGQVGVTKTWKWRSLSRAFKTWMVSSVRSASAFDTSTRLPSSTENS